MNMFGAACKEIEASPRPRHLVEKTNIAVEIRRCIGNSRRTVISVLDGIERFEPHNFNEYSSRIRVFPNHNAYTAYTAELCAEFT